MIKIAMGQMEVIPGNPRANKNKMLSMISEAKKNDVDIIVFPELAISGYMIGDNWDQLAFVRECLYMGNIIREAAKDIVIIFGNIGVDENKCNFDGRLRKYNALYLAQNQKFIGPDKSPYDFCIKTLLPNYRFFDEQRYFTSLERLAAEKACLVQELISPITIKMHDKDFKIAPLICEDSWSESYLLSPTQYLYDKFNPDIFINASCSPFTVGKNTRRIKLFNKQYENIDKPFIYVNSVGLQNNGKGFGTFDGRSAAYAPNGILNTLSPNYEEEITYLEYDALCKNSNPSNIEEIELSPIASIYKALSYCIEKMTTTHNIKKVLVGVSGGIDSAVNAALYASILGPENVYLVTMPSKFNSKETQSMAAKLAENLNCPFAVYPIQEGFENTVNEMNNVIFKTSDNKEVAISLSSFNKENIQARDRSSRILAGIASALGAVFTCNGNKTELAIGYATMYGDLAGFLAATADLWKYQVYELANFLNSEVYHDDVIPLESINVVPSAELSNEQDITQGKGDPLQYDYHDRLLMSFVEPLNRLSPEDLLIAYKNNTLEELLNLKEPISTYFSSTAEWIADLERWWNLQSGFASAKRIQSPPLIMVSDRAYGGDLKEAQMIPYFTDKYFELKEELLNK